MIELVLSLIPLLTIQVVTCQDGSIGGYYNLETQKIRICRQKDNTQNAYSLFHEIGHYVWRTRLTEEQREGYSELHKKSSKEEDFTRPYSQTNEEEDFADTFGAMVLDEWKNYGSRTSAMILKKREYIHVILVK